MSELVIQLVLRAFFKILPRIVVWVPDFVWECFVLVHFASDVHHCLLLNRQFLAELESINPLYFFVQVLTTHVQFRRSTVYYYAQWVLRDQYNLTHC